MGTGCKPVGSAYIGSNPIAPTTSARVAQSAEHFVGNEEVTGSSPVAGSMCAITSYGGIAQLARAHGSYPWRHWFESSYRYQLFIDDVAKLRSLARHLRS